MKDIFFQFEGRIIVITGGLGRIGIGFVNELASRGAVTIVIDIIKPNEAQHRLNKLEKKPGHSVTAEVHYFQADVTNKKQLLNVRGKIMKRFGKIDVLINGAVLIQAVELLPKKIKKDYSFENLDLDEWNRTMAVNITGTMLCCQVFGGVMKSGGSIINISSIYGIVAPDQRIYSGGYKQSAAYGVTKGAVVMLTKFLATYWGHKNIRVNCLAPGGVENDQKRDFIKKYSGHVPLGRMARLADVNGAMLFLASDASAYCTGVILPVDGGWSIW